MDAATIWTVIGSAGGTVGLVYTFLRNFREDIHKDINRLDKRCDEMHQDIKRNEKRLFEIALGKDFRIALKEELKKEKAQSLEG